MRPVLPAVFRLLPVFLVFLLPVRAHALPDATPEESEQRLTVKALTGDLVDYAVRTNPAILAARHSWKAVVEKYRLETALADPELFSSYVVDAQDLSSSKDWTIGLSQAFPFPGTLSRKGAVATLDARIARLEFQKTVRDVAVQVRQSVAELYYLREAGRISRRNQELLDQLVQASVSASAQDRGTVIDMAKAQTQAAQVQYDTLLMAELEAVETARLNALLARPPEAVIGTVSLEPIRPVLYDLPALRQVAADSLEELGLADAEVEKAEAALKVARFATYPELKLGAFYSGIREAGMTPGVFTNKSAVGVQAGISLPLWIGKNQGRRAAAEAEAEKARANRQARENEVNAELSAAFFRLRNAERLVTLYEKDLLPQASRAIATAETWFKEKQGSFSDLVETETVYYNFSLALARARADYEKYLARLEQLCGTSVTTAEPTVSTPSTTPETPPPAKEAP